MKLITFAVASISLIACAHSTPSATNAPTAAAKKINPASLATAEDCQEVYSRVIAIKLFEFEEQTTTPSSGDDERAVAIVIDQAFTANGAKKHFFDRCVGKLTKDQVVCMDSSNNMDAMEMCESVFDPKNQ